MTRWQQGSSPADGGGTRTDDSRCRRAGGRSPPAELEGGRPRTRARDPAPPAPPLPHRDPRARLAAVLGVVFVVPLFVPVVIASFAMITFLVPHGFVSTLLYLLGVHRFPQLVYNATGIVLAQVWVNVPFAVLILGAGLQAIDDVLIDCARDVGAGPARTFLSIILPLNGVPTMIALTLLFIGIFGSFTIPYLVGGNAPQMLGVTMTNYLTQYLRRTEAVTMAVMAFAIAAVVGALYVGSVSRRERGA